MLFPFLLLTTLAITTTLALPSPQPRPSTWKPAISTTTTCQANSSWKITFPAQKYKTELIEETCARLMPICAFPVERPADSDLVCVQTVDWRLTGTVSTQQDARMVDAGTGKENEGFGVKLTVKPALKANDASSVFWTREDCYGYFDELLSKAAPEGCLGGKGVEPGTLTVGGTSSLAGTTFRVEAVEAIDS